MNFKFKFIIHVLACNFIYYKVDCTNVLFWFFKAEEYLKKSLECSEIGQDKNNESICHMNLANIYTEMGEHHKAMKCLEKAIQVRVSLV